MKNAPLALVALMCAMASLHTSAAETAELKLGGTIRPTSCAVTLSANGVIDYGTISAAALSDDHVNVLSRKALNLNVSCDGPTRFAVQAIDDRKGTVVEATEVDNNADVNFGLGTAGNANIGSMNITRKTSPVGDGSPVDLLYQFGSATAGEWEKSSDEYQMNQTAYQAWAVSGQSTPGAFTTVAQALEVEVRLPRKSDLPDLATSVTLDGLATLSLYYL